MYVRAHCAVKAVSLVRPCLSFLLTTPPLHYLHLHQQLARPLSPLPYLPAKGRENQWFLYLLPVRADNSM